MRRRHILAVTAVVVAAHGWLMLGPWDWDGNYALQLPDAPERLETIWVSPPPPQPAPETPPPGPAPRPARQHRPTPAPSVPTTQDSTPPLPDSVALGPSTTPPSAGAEEGEGAEAAEPATAPEAAPAPESAPAPAGPSLQVRDASGSSVALALPADAAPLMQALQLRYQVQGVVKGLQYHASATLEWSTDGNRYQARQSVSAFLLGSMEQTSQGLWTAQGLQPLEFTDRRLTRQRAVHMDWATQQARFTPERPAAPIGPGAQDRLSVFLQLATMLQAMPALRQPGTRIAIPTLGVRRLQIWTFVVEAEETLELPAGPTATLRLLRLPQNGDTETARLWVAASRGYTPARIHMQEANGDVMDFSLKE